jgi:putative Ig domain-containing protein
VRLPGGAGVATLARGEHAYHSLVVLTDLEVASASVSGGTVGLAYSARLQASGGTSPYHWSTSALPPGLTLESSSGEISGTPTQAGAFNVLVTVTDSDGISSLKTLELSIAAAPSRAVTAGATSTPPAFTATAGATRTRPSVTALRLSARTFSLAGRYVKGRCVNPTPKNAAYQRCPRPIKLSVSYTLKRPATVTITLKRLQPGRKVRGRCLNTTINGNKHPNCARLTTVPGKITRVSGAHASRFTFDGKIGGHTIGPGTYRLTVGPSAGGHAGSPQTVTFKILA